MLENLRAVSGVMQGIPSPDQYTPADVLAYMQSKLAQKQQDGYELTRPERRVLEEGYLGDNFSDGPVIDEMWRKDLAARGLVPLNDVGNLGYVANTAQYGNGQGFGGDPQKLLDYVYGSGSSVFSGPNGISLVKAGDPTKALSPTPIAVPNVDGSWAQYFGIPAALMALKVYGMGTAASSLMNAGAATTSSGSGIFQQAPAPVTDAVQAAGPSESYWNTVADAGTTASDAAPAAAGSLGAETGAEAGGLGLKPPTGPALGLGGGVSTAPAAGAAPGGFTLASMLDNPLTYAVPAASFALPSIADAPSETAEEYKLVPKREDIGGSTSGQPGTGLGGKGSSGLGLNFGTGGLLTAEIAAAAGISPGMQSLGLRASPDALLTPDLINAAGGTTNLVIPPSVGQDAATNAGMTSLNSGWTPGAGTIADAAKAAGTATSASDFWGKLLDPRMLIPAIGAITSGVLGTNAANKAAELQAQSADKALAQQRSMFDIIRGDQTPYRNAGAGAAQTLSDMIKPGGFLMTPFTGSSVATDPGYQFGMNEGIKAIDRSAASKGALNNGGTLKALTRYGTDYAGTKFNDAFQRDLATKNQQYGSLAGVASLGQNAAAQTGNAGMNFANNSSNILTQQGNAQAAGSVGQANAISGSLSQFMKSMSDQQILDILKQRQMPQNAQPVLTGGSYGY